jgi:hypothetical protein
MTDLLLTCAISQIILLALDPIFQALRFTARLLNALLHRLGGNLVRHGEEVGVMPESIECRWEEVMRGRWKLR